MLANVVLVGIYGWIQRPISEDLVAEPWHRPLIELIQQLRWHVLFS